LQLLLVFLLGVDKLGERVGIKEAKRIFRKRSVRSQLLDRKKTSKHIVYPYSKNSHKWKKNPDKYDMVGV